VIGTVYLVGAGPGDPGLATVRAVQLLKRADVVVHDRLASPALLRHAPQAALIDVGKGHDASWEQGAINRLLAKEARRGRTVVRLKGGDPFIFGRGGEEAEFLARLRIPCEVVPGVTAAIAAAAYAGIPLTHREHASSVTFLTGHPTLGPIPDVPKSGTLAVYMGVKMLPYVAGELIARGWKRTTPAAVIEWGTTPRQRTVTGNLVTIADAAFKAKIRPPALTIIGAVAAMRRSLSWFERRPLYGRRIVVTRSRDQAGDLTARLLDLGADVIEVPTIEIEPVRHWREVDDAIAHLRSYDAVLFTSQNAVNVFFARLAERGGDCRGFADIRVGAVGPATRDALAQRGLRADWVATEFTTAGLADAVKGHLPKGARVLHPVADRRSPDLERVLKEAGLKVVNLVVYRICRPRETDVSRVAEADLITFASSQTVRNFVALLPAKLRRAAARIPVASIGPVTTQTARELGFRVACQPRRYTIPELVKSICRASR
jgi:uroporphyrinogen III methyltransferase/synthase